MAIVLTFVISWELYLRHKGFVLDYDDGSELWSNNRAMVYEPADKATVFIGSSRIKFDLDIATWQTLTGNHAIQMALVGSDPRPCLHDLANDPNFKGKLLVDVTEGIFFSNDGGSSPNAAIKYYKKRTLAQRAGFEINHLLESQFVLLNKGHFSLNVFLDSLHFKDRKGVFPTVPWPANFSMVTFDRQNKMVDKFLADTIERNQIRWIWMCFGRDNDNPQIITGKALDTIMNSVKVDADRIKARGGEVIFLRTPSNGPGLAEEEKYYPRNKYWDRLLTVTGCKGIYFADYPVISKLICPEYSHLNPRDAIIYTQNLIGILKKEQGWKLK